MTDRLVLTAYVVGWALVRALPERVAQAVFRLGADLAWRRQGPGTRRLRANLARVRPDLDARALDTLARAGLRSYARYWCEVFRLPVLSPARIRRDFRLADEDRLRKAVADGGGVVVALTHSGNWDVAGAWAAATGLPFTTVAERLRPERLFDRFVAFRRSLGMEVVPLSGAGNPFDLLAERLRAGGLLCLLADRDLTARGVEVEFFGGRARFPAGPAALALRTGAVLLPVHLWFTREGWAGRVGEPIPVEPADGRGAVRAATQALARAFEQGIAAHPEDWHMLQRLWLDDLPAGDARRAAP